MDPQDPRLTHYSEPLPGIETDTVFKNETPQNWVEHLRQRGYPIPDYEHDLYRNTREGVQWEDGGPAPLPLAMKSEDHETNFMVDECMKWIGEQNGPWVSHLSLLRPHPPFVAPEPYNRMYDPESLADCIRQPTLEQEVAQHPWLAYQLSRDKKRASVDEKEIRRIKASYYGLMSEVDDALGRLFDGLKALGQWHDTLVVFTSDHGEQMGDHWLMGKCGYFDASYHIPLIIRDPRKQADTTRGTRFDHFTENVDIMPTMLEWLTLKQPSQCDGRSLMPFIEQGHGPEDWRTEVHWEVDFRNILDAAVEEALGINQHQCAMNVIRDEHFKYVHFTALPPLLFDLENDPNEFRNHAQDPEYQGVVLHYAQKLISWRMHHDDRALTETFLSKKGPVTRYSTVQ
jgi:arylsulfatase A-like enzyme